MLVILQNAYRIELQTIEYTEIIDKRVYSDID